MALVYRYFTSSTTWDVPSDVTSVDVLIVAGGGAGQGKSAGNLLPRGGGGAGGVLQLLSEPVTPNSTINIVVGEGGTSGFTNTSATSGGDSSFGGHVAIGGGRGGATDSITGGEALPGGSGGGAPFNGTGAAGTPGQGYSGATGTTNTNGTRAGGGGGASGAGTNGGNQTGGTGGPGIDLTSTVWAPLISFGMPSAIAGGGGGGAYGSSGTQIGGAGGFGGGGAGGNGTSTAANNYGADAEPGTGSGGGGAGGNSSSSGNSSRGGNGAKGFVAIRYDSDTPVVYQIIPATGPESGGTRVLIRGANLTDTLDIKFGGVSASNITVINDSEVICDTPSSLGIVDVEVTTSFGVFTLGSGFEYYEDVETRITQLPIQVIDIGSREVRVTQLPVLFITLPAQPARVTQLPLIAPITPRPVPFPLPLVPEIPVIETWSWLTSVNIKDNGKEQRSSLRETPRKRLKFDFVILGDLSRREVFDILWKYQGREFLYPHYHLSTYVEPAAQGSTSLVFNPAYTDVRDGETLVIYDAHTETTRYASVDVVTSTGADLAEPLEFDIGPASLVCSASMFHLPSSYSLAMDMVSGSSQITLESTEPRPLQRIDGSGLLTYYDGYMVLDKRPMSGVEEGYDRNVNWVDNETSKPSPVTRWRAAFSSGKRSYRFNRRQDMDYWRAFADQAKGRQKSFIMATFFEDLPLAEVPALGATELVTTNIQADEYLHTKVYRYIRIERTDGSVIFRRILDKKLVYDINGDPVRLRLILNNSIGSAVGNNQIKMVSFAPLTRLDSDDVTLSHGDIDTIISFSTRTINE